MRQNYLTYLFLGVIFFGCSQNKSIDLTNKVIEDNQNNEESKPQIEDSMTNFEEENNIKDQSKPFYPIDETMEDIQNQINELKKTLHNM